MISEETLQQQCSQFSEHLDKIYKYTHKKDKNKDEIIRIFKLNNISEYIWNDYKYKLRKSYAVNKINTTKLKKNYPTAYKDCLETYNVKATVIRTKIK